MGPNGPGPGPNEWAQWARAQRSPNESHRIPTWSIISYNLPASYAHLSRIFIGFLGIHLSPVGPIHLGPGPGPIWAHSFGPGPGPFGPIHLGPVPCPFGPIHLGPGPLGPFIWARAHWAHSFSPKNRFSDLMTFLHFSGECFFGVF